MNGKRVEAGISSPTRIIPIHDLQMQYTVKILIAPLPDQLLRDHRHRIPDAVNRYRLDRRKSTELLLLAVVLLFDRLTGLKVHDQAAQRRTVQGIAFGICSDLSVQGLLQPACSRIKGQNQNLALLKVP